jgi:hypothetical protein
VLVSRIGMIGALTAMVIAQWTERLLNVRLILRVLQFRVQNMALLREMGLIGLACAGAAVLSAGVLAFLPPLPPMMRLLAGGIVFGLGYIAAVVGGGILNEEERSILNGYLRPFKLSAGKGAV